MSSNSLPYADCTQQTLTAREYQVMRLVAQGLPNKVCASELGISQRTIEAHRARIFKKLAVRNATELAYKLSQISQA